MKYSINGTGNIVAKRDIYSLGGFIPQGTVGGKIASEEQLSQDGDCWLAAGDISGRPDIRIKGNAYVGTFTPGVNPVHTDGVTEFSGNTLIPGNISVRSFVTDTKNNVFIKDSFIGVSMDVLFGPATTTTAFPFEQGGFNKDVPAGTLFTSASMHTSDANICRTTANLCLGKDTYLYIPTGYSCRVLWGYRNTAGQLAYSGESFATSQALTKLEHPTYKVAMIHVTRVNGTATTPTDLLATGAKVLGHINGSLLQDFRPESASGQYVMVNSSFLTNTDNFGSNTTQLRFLAGSMYDTTMYTQGVSTNYKIYGTFHNVQRLEYTMSLGDAHRTNVNRDTYISAYDCPLLRVDNNTYDTSLSSTGDLTLRRCIVPKAAFHNDIVNGNTYEDIDFSYANEDLGFSMAGYTGFISSHRQGLYRLKAAEGRSNGLVSHKGNLDPTARLYQAIEYTPLDGNIMEQGGYKTTVGTYYEDSKNTSAIRVRTGKPLPTLGAVFPTPPAGFKVTLIAYLGEDFKIQPSQVNPTTIETEYPYFVVVFGKADDSAINVTDFIALNGTLRIIDHTKAPKILGSSYVGAGCTVRGDVKLIGDPYVNRVFDVNMWERGENTMVPQRTWEEGKNLTNQERHFEFKEAIPVEAGGTLSVASGYFMYAGWMDENMRISSTSGAWAASFTVPTNAKFVGLVLKKAASAAATGSFIDESDIPLANVKYVRAFKKRRYIVNELDRTSPEDILLGPDMWEQGSVAFAEGVAYENSKISSSVYIRPKQLINAGASNTYAKSSSYVLIGYEFDALTKSLSGSGATYGRALFGAFVRKEPTAATIPADITNARLVVEFVPTPRIIVPHGVSNVWIEGTKVRMYDNSVISRTITKGMGVILKGDAVMGSVFTGDVCMCSNGHGDAILNK